MRGYFSEQVVINLMEFQSIFKLSTEEIMAGIIMADKIGWQAARPSTISLVIIRILKPNIPNSMIYQLGRTELQTMRKWTSCVCAKLGIKDNFFIINKS